MLHEKRWACYVARDAYFECLSKDGARREKKVLRRAYEKHCPKSWVTHFDKKRVEDEKLQKLLEIREGNGKEGATKAA